MHLDPKTWWYLTRATGFVAWALLAASVLWGLFITNKTLVRSTPPAWVLDLHRHLGGLAVVFVGIHVAALPLDTYTDWGWQDLFVPMASRWHPVPVAIGIVAMYLLLAVEVTSLLGTRMPRKWWRRVHFLSFPLFVLASVHLFAAGTDAGNGIARWTVVVVSTLVVFLAGVRGLAVAKPRETKSRVPAAARVAASKPAAEPEVAAAPAPVEVADAGDLLPATQRRNVPSPFRAVIGAAGRPEPGQVAESAPPRARLRPPTIDERAERIRTASRQAAARATPVASS